MRSHDKISVIAAFTITFVIAMFILLTMNRCEAWTGHEFQARLSGGNDWKITSLPKAIDSSEEYDMAGRLGYLSYVYAVREDSKWDADLMFMGPITYAPEKVIKQAKIRIVPMMIAMDKILPDEAMIVISFAVDFVEMSVFFGPERWKNENFHVEVAEKLNIEREKWKK